MASTKKNSSTKSKASKKTTKKNNKKTVRNTPSKKPAKKAVVTKKTAATKKAATAKKVTKKAAVSKKAAVTKKITKKVTKKSSMTKKTASKAQSKKATIKHDFKINQISDHEVDKSKLPLSPHIWLWRWRSNMISSIAHRISGVALFISLFSLSFLLLATQIFTDQYDLIYYFLFNKFFQPFWAIVVLSLFYHILNGIRHLLLDLKIISSYNMGNLSAKFVLILAVILTVTFYLTII